MMGKHFICFVFFGLCFAQPALATESTVESPAGHAQAAVAGAHDTAAPVDSEHSAHQGEHGAAASHHGEHEDVSFSDINWVYGLIGESEDPEPSLLFRPKGMPAPFLATFINWAVLMSLIVVFARKQLPAALKKRKAAIVQGMEEAGRIKSVAESRLHELEDKLSHVDEAIEEIKADMKRSSESERERILLDAVERRGRLERDAARLIETELEAAKEDLRREIVDSALRQASEQVKRQLTEQDQQALFEEALGSLKHLPANSLGDRS